MDADGSHRVEDLVEMFRLTLPHWADIVGPPGSPNPVRWLDGCDVVVGSRYVRGGKSWDSIPRQFISRVYTFLARFLLAPPVRDPLSGFIVARKSLLEAIDFTSGYKFGLALLSLAKRKDLDVGEIGICFLPRKAGKSKAGAVTGIRTLLDIVRLRLQY